MTEEIQEMYENYLWKYHSFDFYKIPDNPEEWSTCPECGLKPKIWEFDNGRYAHCVCGEDRYHHKYEATAKPIRDYVREDNGFQNYNRDDLRINWNNKIKK